MKTNSIRELEIPKMAVKSVQKRMLNLQRCCTDGTNAPCILISSVETNDTLGPGAVP